MTTVPAGKTPTQQAGEILHGLLSQFAGDLINSGTGILTTSLTSLQKTPTLQNVIAQGAAIALTGPLVLPTLEGEGIGQFATAGLQLITLLQTLVPKA